jgi:hypothetical protein
MEGNRQTPERTLQRRFEGYRLEEQLWSTAYEQIWPVIRRSLKQSVEQRLRCQGSDSRENLARRA